MNPILFSTRPLENHNYKIYNKLGIKLLNRLTLNFCYLKQRKFGHNFTDTINPFINVMFLFPWNWANFPFFYAAETTPFTAQLLWMNSAMHVALLLLWSKMILILHGDKTLIAATSKYDGDKNFDSDSNQSILTTTIKSIRYN